MEKLPSVKGVLVTAGGRGSSYAFRAACGKMDMTGYVPVLSVKVVETTGAGDAFLGGFTHKLLQVISASLTWRSVECPNILITAHST